MLSVVTFKWKPLRQYRSQFDSSHVNVLRTMIERHYEKPHKFFCVTDDPEGLDNRIEAVPLWDDFKQVPSPHGAAYPSCYRRLKMYSQEAENIFGRRFVTMDLDAVVMRDVSPLWDRTEDFVIWAGTNNKTHYNGSMTLMTAGSRREVWDDFNPYKSPHDSVQAGQFGSDQGWISHKLGFGQPTWKFNDGVVSYSAHMRSHKGILPRSARIVFFNGKVDPWSPEAQALPWVRKHWC